MKQDSETVFLRTCRNSMCVNPEHIRTHFRSMKGFKNKNIKKRTPAGVSRPKADKCFRGHDTRTLNSRNNKRRCRECVRLATNLKRSSNTNENTDNQIPWNEQAASLLERY